MCRCLIFVHNVLIECGALVIIIINNKIIIIIIIIINEK